MIHGHRPGRRANSPGRTVAVTWTVWPPSKVGQGGKSESDWPLWVEQVVAKFEVVVVTRPVLVRVAINVPEI
jgi:hypothetical protein